MSHTAIVVLVIFILTIVMIMSGRGGGNFYVIGNRFFLRDGGDFRVGVSGSVDGGRLRHAHAHCCSRCAGFGRDDSVRTNMKKTVGQNLKFEESKTLQPSQFCDINSVIKSPCCTILESISDGVFTVDRDKRINSFNHAAESITGFKNEEAVGKFCFDVFRANICEKRCALDRTIDSGNSQINLHAVIISKAGKQKTISISTAILKNMNGEIIGGVETFRDLSDLEELRRQLNRTFTHEDIIGQHPRMREILSFLPDIAESESPVLVQGPTGSGKELIARALHNLSPRKDGPFIAVNCAALPETLLESELFGYQKGAFTGAMRDKAGRFALANRGTLFLDEISNTSKAFQADLFLLIISSANTIFLKEEPFKG